MANNGFYTFSETGLVHSSIGYEITFDFTNLTNPRTYTFLDSSGTIVLLGSNGFIPNSEINWGSPSALGNVLPNTVAGTTLTGTITDVGTTTVVDVLTIAHRSSGTPTVGFGTEILLQGDTANNTLHNMAVLTTTWSSTSGINGIANLDLSIYNNNTKQSVLNRTGSQVTVGGAGTSLTFLVGECQLALGQDYAWSSGNGSIVQSSSGMIKILNGGNGIALTNVGTSAVIRPQGAGVSTTSFDVNDANTGSIINVANVTHTLTTANDATNNKGVAFGFKVANSTSAIGASDFISLIENWWSNATNTSGNLAMLGQISGYYNLSTVITKKPIMFWGVNGAGNPLWSVFSVTTPIVQPTSSTALDTMATSLGLRASGGVSNFDTDVKISNVGNGIYIKEGTNATMGIATLVAGTVTVNTTKVTANSRIFISVNGVGVLANLGSSYENTATRVAGTSFDIKSTNVLDTSSVVWCIIEPA